MFSTRIKFAAVLAGLVALPACQKSTDNPAPVPVPVEPKTNTPAPSASAGPATPGTPAETDLSQQIQIVTSDGSSIPLENPSRIMQLETQLLSQGVSPGTVDGRADATLVGALRQFQGQKGLKATGKVDAETAKALGLSWNDMNLGDVQKVSGSENAPETPSATPVPAPTDEDKEKIRKAAEDVKDGLQKGAEDLQKPASSTSSPPESTTPKHE